jgi:SAM-dependent methyltransferase
VPALDHTELIQSLIDENDVHSYLEIGVDRGINFAAVRCDLKVGVDPSPSSAATDHMTSDEFFAANDREWDLVFVDGLHHADQVKRDVENALDCLAEGGVIVCHDMNPTSERMQRVPRAEVVWTGDCWRAWVELRARPGLDMRVIDADFGCGVITRGDGVVLEVDDPLTYEGLEANRREWLNLVTVDQWLADSGHALDR